MCSNISEKSSNLHFTLLSWFPIPLIVQWLLLGRSRGEAADPFLLMHQLQSAFILDAEIAW